MNYSIIPHCLRRAADPPFYPVSWVPTRLSSGRTKEELPLARVRVPEGGEEERYLMKICSAFQFQNNMVPRHRFRWEVCIALAVVVAAMENGAARKPPLGWSTWNGFG